jgi:hypothetical protein
VSFVATACVSDPFPVKSVSAWQVKQWRLTNLVDLQAGKCAPKRWDLAGRLPEPVFFMS